MLLLQCNSAIEITVPLVGYARRIEASLFEDCQECRKAI